MNHSVPIPLTAAQIIADSPEFQAICGWPFADAYITRLLLRDIPQRMAFGNCSVWTYRDPGGSLVGFGTLDVATDCGEYTGNRPHPYIPLLAIDPTIKSRGYGTSILDHLIGEAALLASAGLCFDVLFLDVYTANTKAITLYCKLGFQQISPVPIPDPSQDGEPFIVMGKRVAVEPGIASPPNQPRT